MTELERIHEAVRQVLVSGKRGLLLTVAGTKGSTYRRAGARAVVVEDGATCGLISGGCLERDVAERAKIWLEDFRPRVVTYDSSRFDDVVFGLGLGCRGMIDIVVQPFDAGHPPPLPAIPADVPTVHTTIVDGVEILTETILPQRRAIIFGGGSDVEPVTAMMRAVGWSAEAVSPKVCHPGNVSATYDLARFDAAVVMTHNFLYDQTLFEVLLRAGTRYIGLLGPKSRGDELIENASGVTDEQRQRIHSPAGLDLGGDTPEEIALSIVAEIQSVFNGSSSEPLRSKSGPIHEVAPGVRR